ncbi:MAG: TIGR04442 family protein, partial [Desulfuromonadales bacterium]|nr:TIGR04442 family protein [Desulfuromonadales bacterium]
ILRLLGKILKRSENVGIEDDSELVEELFSLLGHKSSLYLVKLINKKHKAYHEAFTELYFTHKSIPDEEYDKLKTLADNLGIDKYQQERIRIDVMY